MEKLFTSSEYFQSRLINVIKTSLWSVKNQSKLHESSIFTGNKWQDKQAGISNLEIIAASMVEIDSKNKKFFWGRW